MKKLKDLNGAKLLSKSEQKSINGGRKLPELCASSPNLVFCYAPAVCAQAPDGSWYCA
jgi:hypothetical protein